MSTQSTFTLVTFIQGLFPDNIIAAAAKFQIMPVVVYAVVFAMACIACGEVAKPVAHFFSVLRDVFIKMIMWLMYLAPIGLFALLSNATARAVQDNILMASLKGVGLFIGMFLCGLLLQVLWQGVLAKIITQLQVHTTAKAVASAMMTAFATASSMATLPVAKGWFLKAAADQYSDGAIRYVAKRGLEILQQQETQAGREFLLTLKPTPKLVDAGVARQQLLLAEGDELSH